jgi:O-antigen biosynthesis protein
LVRYYDLPRADVLRHVPPTARAVLDVGCGAGTLGGSIKQRQGSWVVGVEYVPEQAARAAELLDEVHIGDVGAISLPYPPASFDCLIYSDVLEHLVDPWAILKRHRELVQPGGTMIVSLPNAQFFAVSLGLIRGSWNYGTRGILDRTHLRFFTRRSAWALVEDAGYVVTGIHRLFRWFDDPASSLHRYARVAAPIPWLRDLLTYQFILVARPRSS